MNRNKTFGLLLAVAIFGGGALTATGQEDDASKEKKTVEGWAESGNPKAQYLLGVFYQEGIHGRIKNPEKAFELMKKSAYQGYVPAFVHMADYYALKDNVEAYAWSLLYKANADTYERQEAASELVKTIEEESSIRNDAEKLKQGQDRARELQKQIAANQKKKAEEKTEPKETKTNE